MHMYVHMCVHKCVCICVCAYVCVHACECSVGGRGCFLEEGGGGGWEDPHKMISKLNF